MAAATGAMLQQLTVPAAPAGYQQLLELADRHDGRRVWAIEGTGGYGAGLTRFLQAQGEQVVELDRPKRAARRHGAKSDPLDAARAAVMASRTERPDSRAFAFVHLAEICARYGDAEQAAGRLAVAATEVLRVPDPVERMTLVELLTDTWATAAGREQGGPIRAAVQALAEGGTADAEVRAVALLVVARAALREGGGEGGSPMLAAARRVAATIDDPERAAVLLDAAVRIEDRPVVQVDAQVVELAVSGRLGLARVQALAEVALAQAHAGRREDAPATIQVAAKEAGDIESQPARALAAAALARARAAVGEAGSAAADLAAARESAGRLADRADKADVLAAVAQAEAEAGNQAGAEETLAAVAAAAERDLIREAGTLQRLAELQLALGDLAGALATCDRLEGEGAGTARALRLRIAWAQAANHATRESRQSIALVLGPEPSAAGASSAEEPAGWRLARIGRLRMEAGALDPGAGAQDQEAGPLDQARQIAGWVEDETVRAALLAEVAEYRRSAGRVAGDGAPAGPAAAASFGGLADASGGVTRTAAEDRPGEPTGAGVAQGQQALTEQRRRETETRARRFEQDAVRTAEWLKTDWSRPLLDDAALFVRLHQRTNLERLLVPCAHYQEAAYGMCALLAIAYPGQAGKVAAAVRQFD